MSLNKFGKSSILKFTRARGERGIGFRLTRDGDYDMINLGQAVTMKGNASYNANEIQCLKSAGWVSNDGSYQSNFNYCIPLKTFQLEALRDTPIDVRVEIRTSKTIPSQITK